MLYFVIVSQKKIVLQISTNNEILLNYLAVKYIYK